MFLGCSDCCEPPPEPPVLRYKTCLRLCSGSAKYELFRPPPPSTTEKVTVTEGEGPRLWDEAKAQVEVCMLEPVEVAFALSCGGWGYGFDQVKLWGGFQQPPPTIIRSDGVAVMWPSIGPGGTYGGREQFAFVGHGGKAAWEQHSTYLGAFTHEGAATAWLRSYVSFVFAKLPPDKSFQEAFGKSSVEFDFTLTHPDDYPPVNGQPKVPWTFRFLNKGAVCFTEPVPGGGIHELDHIAGFGAYQNGAVTFGYGSSAVEGGNGSGSMLNDLFAGNVTAETTAVAAPLSQTVVLTNALQHKVTAAKPWWWLAVYADPPWWNVNPLPDWPGNVNCYNYKGALAEVSSLFINEIRWKE